MVDRRTEVATLLTQAKEVASEVTDMIGEEAKLSDVLPVIIDVALNSIEISREEEN